MEAEKATETAHGDVLGAVWANAFADLPNDVEEIQIYISDEQAKVPRILITYPGY